LIQLKAEIVHAEAVVRADGSNIFKSKLSINNHLTISQALITTREHA